MVTNSQDCIGVFDSGLGGLTVLKQMVEKMPSANIIYFGDTKHAPYGDRSQAELGALTANAFNFLKSKNVTKIVTACNSISTLLMDDFLKTCNLDDNDVIEMSQPIAEVMSGKYKKVLVLATSATVHSHMHRNSLEAVGIYADEMAIPGLVNLIESGANNRELEEHVVGTLGIIDVSGYDAILLGCTHFPFALDAFKSAINRNIEFIDPASAVASKVAESYKYNEGKGSLRFFITKESRVFNKKVHKMFGDTYEVNMI